MRLFDRSFSPGRRRATLAVLGDRPRRRLRRGQLAAGPCSRTQPTDRRAAAPRRPSPPPQPGPPSANSPPSAPTDNTMCTTNRALVSDLLLAVLLTGLPRLAATQRGAHYVPALGFCQPTRALTDCACVPDVVARAFGHGLRDPVDCSTTMEVVEMRGNRLETQRGRGVHDSLAVHDSPTDAHTRN